VLATSYRSKNVRGARRFKVSRVSRGFRNKVSQAVRNPMVYSNESRTALSWYPASCNWAVSGLGTTGLYAQFMTQAIQNYNPDEIITRNGEFERVDLKLRVDMQTRTDMFMNMTNSKSFISCYRLTPKQDITAAEEEPVALLAIGNADLKDNTSGAPVQSPFPYDDYRFTPYMASALTKLYTIKFVKNVAVMPGGRVTFRNAVRPLTINKVATQVSNEFYPGSILQRGKASIMLYKCWGDMGIYTPVGQPPSIRNAEGSFGLIVRTKAKFHLMNDERIISRSTYLTDDRLGQTTIINQPESVSTFVAGAGLPTPL